jgi:hypothetical protein
VTTPLAFVGGGSAQVVEGVEALVTDQIDIAATAAITPGRPTARNELLTAERHATVAATTTANMNDGFVEEVQDLISAETGKRAAAPEGSKRTPGPGCTESS